MLISTLLPGFCLLCKSDEEDDVSVAELDAKKPDELISELISLDGDVFGKDSLTLDDAEDGIAEELDSFAPLCSVSMMLPCSEVSR